MLVTDGNSRLKHPLFWLLLICTISAATQSIAAQISSKTVYFTVSGNTPGEVLRSILANGPGGHSGLAMATTQARISQSVNTKKKGKCRPTTKALIITHMPRLSKSSRKVPAVRAQWGKFISYVKRHEARHKSIYIGCTKKIERLVRASFRKHGCRNARSRVNTIMQAENARCARLNAAYDRSERGRIKKLGLLSRASGVTGIIFGKHDKKSSRRLRPNRN